MTTSIRALATIHLTLALAIRHDLIDSDGNWRSGTMYFLRSGISGEFDGRPFYVTSETDKKELAEQFKARMVYVARNSLERVPVTYDMPRNEPVHAPA